MKYKIQDCATNKTVEVEAPGIVEAMWEFLPGDSLQLLVDFKPVHCGAMVKDKKTGACYTVRY